MIAVTVTNRRAVAVPLSDVTTGAVGIPVSFRFSEDWDDLSKIAVFKTDSTETPVEMAVLLNATTVPHEILTTPYEILWIGVYGSNAQGTKVTPTIWANAGAIQPGTELETIDPSEPTPSWVAQVQAAAEQALLIAQGIQTAAQNGEFDGEDGAAGADGISPTASVSEITGGHKVTISYGDGLSVSFNVMDGKGQKGDKGDPGLPGDQGPQGQKGDAGADGFSPAVTVSSITGGHKVTITDKTHPSGQSFDVMDGADGAEGPQGPDGEKGDQGEPGNGVSSFHEYGSGTEEDGRPYIDYVFEFDDESEEVIRVHDGKQGDAYVLTEADKQEIAGIAIEDEDVFQDETGQSIKDLVELIEDYTHTIADITGEDTGVFQETTGLAIEDILEDIRTAVQTIAAFTEYTGDTELSDTSEMWVQNKVVKAALDTITQSVSALDTALKAGTQATAVYHLGFYLDGNGDLCQVED